MALLACAACQSANAEGLRLSVGVTTESAENLEVAYSLKKWDFALGYVGSQVIDAIMKTDFCAEPFQLPPCELLVVDTTLKVQPYYYASVQRILELRSERFVRPFVGLGLSAFSDTNPLVSSPIGFSVIRWESILASASRCSCGTSVTVAWTNRTWARTY